MNRYGWIALLLMSTAIAAPAASCFVATDGKPENDGSREKPWPSVEYALSKVVANNILVSEGEEVLSFNEGTTNVLVDYNLCLPNSAHNGPHGVTGEPMFVDAKKGLFWLRADSPARGKGSLAYAPGTDFWGRSRAKDQPVDLGAMPFIPELAKAEALQRFEYGWAYYRHGSGGTIPDLWQLPGSTP